MDDDLERITIYRDGEYAGTGTLRRWWTGGDNDDVRYIVEDCPAILLPHERICPADADEDEKAEASEDAYVAIQMAIAAGKADVVIDCEGTILSWDIGGVD